FTVRHLMPPSARHVPTTAKQPRRNLRTCGEEMIEREAGPRDLVSLEDFASGANDALHAGIAGEVRQPDLHPVIAHEGRKLDLRDLLAGTHLHDETVAGVM